MPWCVQFFNDQMFLIWINSYIQLLVSYMYVSVHVDIII